MSAETAIPERQLTRGSAYESSNDIYAPSNGDDRIGRCTLRSSAVHIAGSHQEGAGTNPDFSAGLQPVPTGDSPTRLEFGDSQGPAGDRRHRR
jgi:hypothetical protein